MAQIAPSEFARGQPRRRSIQKEIPGGRGRNRAGVQTSEDSIAKTRHQIIDGVAPGTWNHTQHRRESPRPAESDQDCKHSVRANPRTFRGRSRRFQQDQRVRVANRGQVVARQRPFAEATLQRRETKALAPIPSQYELNVAIAEAAVTVVEQNRARSGDEVHRRCPRRVVQRRSRMWLHNPNSIAARVTAARAATSLDVIPIQSRVGSAASALLPDQQRGRH